MSIPHPSPELVLRCSDLSADPLVWLWPGRLAAGKITLLDGDPGLGKSLMTLDLVARGTSSGEFPDGHRLARPVSALLISVEDGVCDTVYPRLQAAGADLARVHIFRGRLDPKTGELGPLPSFPEDCDLLREILRTTRAKLLVIDPLMAVLSANCSGINDQLVRRALSPLAAVAQEFGACVLVVRHLNKGGRGQPALYRGSGSIGIVGAARTAFLVGRDPDDPDRRILACTKNNLAPDPPSLAYRLGLNTAGQPVVVWDGESDLNADELAGNVDPPNATALGQARDWLSNFLGKGPCEARVALAKARDVQIAPRHPGAGQEGTRRPVPTRVERRPGQVALAPARDAGPSPELRPAPKVAKVASGKLAALAPGLAPGVSPLFRTGIAPGIGTVFRAVVKNCAAQPNSVDVSAEPV